MNGLVTKVWTPITFTTLSIIRSKYAEGHIHTNGAENFWTLFKRCIGGTYVSVEWDHLPAYLDEELFRFNERDGKDKHRFVKVAQGIEGKRLTYRQLIATEDGMSRRGNLRKINKNNAEQ